MGGGANPNDPLVKILQQMMGGFPGSGGAGPGGPGSIPGMPALGMPEQDGAGLAAPGDAYAYLWRIVHAVFALGLGLYIAFTAEFTGTKLARDMSALGNAAAGNGLAEDSVRFFYIFATAEVILQTLRFVVEKGTVQPSGLLGVVMGFLPQPWNGYLTLVLRYGRIWTTTSGDALVCIFVLGVCSWLRAV